MARVQAAAAGVGERRRRPPAAASSCARELVRRPEVVVVEEADPAPRARPRSRRSARARPRVRPSWRMTTQPRLGDRREPLGRLVARAVVDDDHLVVDPRCSSADGSAAVESRCQRLRVGITTETSSARSSRLPRDEGQVHRQAAMSRPATRAARAPGRGRSARRRSALNSGRSEPSGHPVAGALLRPSRREPVSTVHVTVRPPS